MNEGHTMNVYQVELAIHFNNLWSIMLMEVNAIREDYAILQALGDARGMLFPAVDLSVNGCTYLYPVEG